MSEPLRAALFDLDRTLVTRDTATLYIKFEREQGDATLFDMARVAWWMAQYTAGVIDAVRVSQKVAQGYRGKSESWMIERGQLCFRRYVLPYISKDGRAAVERHRRAGHLLAIATSGTPYIARPLADELGVEHLISSRMEVREGKFTGQLLQPLCFGPGKASLARSFALEHGFALEDAYFYSDSITDLPLLQTVHTPVVVNPDARLRHHARRLAWRQEHWD